MTDSRPGLCLDFANTFAAGRKGDGADGLSCLADLAAWLEKTGTADGSRVRGLRRMERADPTKAERLLARAKRLREAVYRAMAATAADCEAEEADLEEITREAVAAARTLQIRRTDEAYAWAVVDDSPDAAIAPIALSAAALLTGPDLHRVRECGNETCGWLFLDNSKNQSRKWCDMSDCGNKMKARRHYARLQKAKKRSS